jgi:hypothetical protein
MSSKLSFALVVVVAACALEAAVVEAQATVVWLVKPCEETPCTMDDPECGRTWAKAFCTLQEALAVAVHDESPPQGWKRGRESYLSISAAV